MVAVSLSPVFLTLSFLNFFGEKSNFIRGIIYLTIAFIMIIVSFGLIKLAETKLEVVPIRIRSVSTADKEALSFIFVYLLPLISIDVKVLMFTLVSNSRKKFK